MKIIALVTFILLSSCKILSQLQELQPSSVIPLDFSEAAQAKWAKRDNLLKQIDSGAKSWDHLSADEEKLMNDCPELYSSIWDILG